MHFDAPAATLPLTTAPDGAVRIGATRVTLDTVVSAFINGSTCEEIIFQYPALDLADVYAVIGFYLKNRRQVDLYLAQRQAEAGHLQQSVQQQFPSAGIRQRLLERAAAQQSSTAA